MMVNHWKEIVMKKNTILVTLLLATVAALLPAISVADTYTLDPDHSYVDWKISHFGYSHPSGKWFANGTLDLNQEKPQDSKGSVTINMAEMVTGIPKLDEHLKGDQFFDVAKYPTAAFVSDKVTLTGKDSAKVKGMLTLHGVTKPVTLNVKINRMGTSPVTNKLTAGFAATAEIKRLDFGVRAFLPGLGDKVTLNIEVEANK